MARQGGVFSARCPRYNVPMLALMFALACAPHLYTDATRESGCTSWVAPENLWPRTEELPCEFAGSGFNTGDVPPELVALDQSGASVSLWQFYGHVTVVDISTMWCAPCQDLAEGVTETAEAYAPQDVVYITVLAENLENEVPSVEDLVYWADNFHITSPVLSDTEGWYVEAVPLREFPRVMVLDEDLQVCAPNVAANDAAVRTAIEACL